MHSHIFKVSYLGWQSIPSNWVCNKGFFTVCITNTMDLRLLCVKKCASGSITFFCFLCKRKSCHHTNDNIPNREILRDSYEFNYDHDFDKEEEIKELKNLVSTKRYPCKYNLFIKYCLS